MQRRDSINDKDFSKNDIRKRYGGTYSGENMLGGIREECKRTETAIECLIASNIARLKLPPTKCSQSPLATFCGMESRKSRSFKV